MHWRIWDNDKANTMLNKEGRAAVTVLIVLIMALSISKMAMGLQMFK
ncbi:hypothetical protein V12G01_18417 [Vibrio alginolyticus 12G01]|uniref:Uncharacterized protein n=1 Tax=Vibrio alginolyticus (strain ATCC 17749 / DSM 2171 / NBRC 15630 / NCIMB 1903 / NCTC 12160 / XII-53) TaxID=1219076 RepID=A0A2I3C1V4_VIBAX|nr:hypothetical protein N646_0546 [Vibrio alginolyticus NBRC 15630 = ATCC 17749]EAS77503.1 hypothetical protein V12G01_18417 [Vibrio alginolyticus 12G01]